MTIALNPGSFKDPDGRVLHVDGRVLRTLSPEAERRMEDLLSTSVFQKLVDDQLVIPTHFANDTSGVPPLEGVWSSRLLEHAPLDMVTYPYEWSFEMFRDAALTTLTVLRKLLDGGYILKDGTPFNVMHFHGRMTFIDILSIDRYQQGQPWEGYAQFCRQFLFPLMAASHKGFDFRAYLRGKPDGMTAGEITRILGVFGFRYKGSLRHVYLHSALEQAFGGNDVGVRENITPKALPKQTLYNIVDSLYRVIEKLSGPTQQSEWSDYTATCTYTKADTELKATMIQNGLTELAPESRLVDLGSNTGEFSLIAADIMKLVISMDIDNICVDKLYKRLQNGEITNIVPLFTDLCNPAPAQGWGLVERPSLFERLQADHFIALALVHHICISANVPVPAFVELLAQFSGGIVEWVDKTDPMVQQLLRNRVDIFDDYTWDYFLACLKKQFDVTVLGELNNGTRRLCLVKRLP